MNLNLCDKCLGLTLGKDIYLNGQQLSCQNKLSENQEKNYMIK